MKYAIILAAAVFGVAGLLAGCATTSATPEAMAEETVIQYVEALEAQDLDSLIALFAEDFDHYEYGDKEGVRQFVGQAIDMGYLEGAEVSLDDAEYTVNEDGSVVAYPIGLSASFGTATMELTLQERDGTYKVTAMELEGV